ncbi:hypothetical protein KQX54_004542 [Cotesia glomerata]|uniref:Uncharacterized protein n=1 Tax=Cotesia glomerata TaxID=32391 RepID=A0AAV7I6Y1_COTGL|nr:hypothetical protein KQX54_004542 [Cotesia glomerata]
MKGMKTSTGWKVCTLVQMRVNEPPANSLVHRSILSFALHSVQSWWLWNQREPLLHWEESASSKTLRGSR